MEVSDTLIDENWGTKKFANLLKVTQLVNSRDSNSGSLALIHYENLFQTQRNLGWRVVVTSPSPGEAQIPSTAQLPFHLIKSSLLGRLLGRAWDGWFPIT